jgi:pimeloyl-ACP methyl ester carboxylesterase
VDAADGAMASLALAGATLFYEQTGAGPDIVWLAAGDHPGANWRRFQTPAFEPGFRNTTYDARGVGATRADAPPPWPIEEHARDCAALIEAACAPPVFLVGLSMGSLIAQELACSRPELVRAALVMGTCARKTGFIREWEEAEIALHRDGGGLPAAFATAHYATLYYPAEVLCDDALWARIRPLVAQDFECRDGRMLAAQWQACLDYESTALLPRCTVPIHAIAFSHDVQTPPARVREVAELAPRGRFHLLEGLGHGSAFGHRPDVVNACLRSIVDAELAR